MNQEKTKLFSLQVAEEGQTDAPQDQLRGKVVKFGWMDGVFVSLNLNSKILSEIMISRKILF